MRIAVRRSRGVLNRTGGPAPIVAAALLAAWAVGAVGAARATAATPSSSPSSARRVLLIIERANDPLAERIRAEIAGVGLPVVILEPWRTRGPARPLEETARAQRAAAVVRVLPSRKGVEVWMADETSGRSLLRQLIVDESAGGPNQGLIALQTAELLRTSLLSAAPSLASPARGDTNAGVTEAPPSLSPSPSSPPSPPSSSSAQVASPSSSPVVVVPSSSSAASEIDAQAALGAMASAGGGGAAFQAWLSLHRSFGRRLGLALDITAPLRAASLSGPEGSARLAAHMAGIALVARWELPASGFHGTAGAGFAAVRVSVDGRASAPLVATSDAAYTAAGYLRADAAWEVTRWLRVGVRGVGGASLGAVRVRFAANDAATWGRPFVAAFGLADLRWR
jgi:hypothetical protein